MEQQQRKLSDMAVDDEARVDEQEQEEESYTPELPKASGDDIPDGFVVPKDLRVPRGRQVLFITIRAGMTDTPAKGDRQCICWTLSDGDEKVATDRCEGKAGRASAEYTKQMIRSVDGHVVNWMRPRGPGSIDEFWQEVGGKGRNLLMRTYSRLHLADDEEVRDFFENCIAVRSAV